MAVLDSSRVQLHPPTRKDRADWLAQGTSQIPPLPSGTQLCTALLLDGMLLQVGTPVRLQASADLHSRAVRRQHDLEPDGRTRTMQEEKKGGGLFGTVKSLLGGGNNTEAQVCLVSPPAQFLCMLACMILCSV